MAGGKHLSGKRGTVATLIQATHSGIITAYFDTILPGIYPVLSRFGELRLLLGIRK